MKNFRIAILFALIVSLLIVIPAAASTQAAPTTVQLSGPVLQEPAPIPSLSDALKFLTSAGGIGVAVSFILEQRKWFQSQSTNTKFWLVFGVSIGTPLVAKLILDFVPPNIIQTIEPYWNVVAVGLGAFLASQWYHGSGPGSQQQQPPKG